MDETKTLVVAVMTDSMDWYNSLKLEDKHDADCRIIWLTEGSTMTAEKAIELIYRDKNEKEKSS